MLLRLSNARALPLRGGTGGTPRRRVATGAATTAAVVEEGARSRELGTNPLMTLPEESVLRGGLRRFDLTGGGGGSMTRCYS